MLGLLHECEYEYDDEYVDEDQLLQLLLLLFLFFFLDLDPDLFDPLLGLVVLVVVVDRVVFV